MAYNKVVYGGNTLIDLTSDTVVPEALLEGYIAHKADGSIITGTYAGASASEEIDRILMSGLTDGYKYIMDDGTITSNSESTGYTLIKTFSNNFQTCTAVLTDADGNELGRTVKTYSDDCQIITTTDKDGRTLVKTFTSDLKKCTSVLTDPDGKEIARQVKTFNDDGSVIESVVTYL